MPAPPAPPPIPPAPRPHWSTITVAGHACELFEPPGAEPGRAAIYLHGVHESWLQESAGLCDAIEAADPQAAGDLMKEHLAFLRPAYTKGWEKAVRQKG